MSSFFIYAMLSRLVAKQDTPAPGKVILEVEANSNTMSGLPASRQYSKILGKGTYSPSNSCTQYALSHISTKSLAAGFMAAMRRMVASL